MGGVGTGYATFQPGSEGSVAGLDFNGDGSANIADSVGSLNFLFGGGPRPPPPGPADEPCGPDPDPEGSPGDLGCESYTGC